MNKDEDGINTKILDRGYFLATSTFHSLFLQMLI